MVKKINNTGILLNIADGGEGPSGLCGKLNPAYGKKRPDVSARNKLGQGPKTRAKLAEFTGEKSSGFGSRWYNNGLVEIFIKTEPPEGYIAGRLPLSKETIDKITSKSKGSKWYTDGTKTVLVKTGKSPPPNFYPGRVFSRKKK